MKQRAAAVIVKDEKILLMCRRKIQRDYCVIPGGSIEDGETPEITVLREMKEETNLEAEIDYLLFDFESNAFKRHEYFFAMKNIKGEERIGEPEISWENENNHYKLEWVELAKIPEINLLPTEIKEKIIETYCQK